MLLTIKGIEAAKPQTNKKTGKQTPVKLSDGNGLMLFVTSQNIIRRARYFYMGKEQNLTLGKYTALKNIAEKTVSICNFAIALGKTENNPAYTIRQGLSCSNPSKNNNFPSITGSEEIGRLLLDIDDHARNATANPKPRRSIKVCYAARILPYVFLRPAHLVESKWASPQKKHADMSILQGNGEIP